MWPPSGTCGAILDWVVLFIVVCGILQYFLTHAVMMEISNVRATNYVLSVCVHSIIYSFAFMSSAVGETYSLLPGGN